MKRRLVRAAPLARAWHETRFALWTGLFAPAVYACAAPYYGMVAKSEKERSFPNLVDKLDEGTRSTAVAVRDLVLECMPDAEETIHGGSKVGLALYGLRSNGKVVCGIQPRDTVCLVYFHRVSRADSQLPLEGKGTHSLHMKVSALDQVILAQLRSLLRIARERAEVD